MRAHRVVLLVLAACLSVLLAGCGGQQTPGIATAQTGHPTVAAATSTGSPTGASHATAAADMTLSQYIAVEQKFVDCLRSNGLTDVPDPDDTGAVLIPGKDANNPAMDRARTACQKDAVPPPASVIKLRDQQNAAAMTPAETKMEETYAACMQANGAPDFPDWDPSIGDWAGSDQLHPPEWDETSAGAQRASATCGHIVGDPSTPGPGVG